MPLAMLRAVAILVLVLALSGCAAFSAGGIKAESARFRHAARQGRLSGKGLKVYFIQADEFSLGCSFAAVRDAKPSSEGAQLLQDEVLTDVEIAKTVNDSGLPAAIGLASSYAGQIQRFAMFYKTPPRSVVLKRSSMDVEWLTLSELYKSHVVADLPAVPRSVQRLALNEGLIAPPWPVTIPPDLIDEFSVPHRPDAPPSEVEAHDYAEVANDLAARLPQSANAQNRQRAEAALVKLVPVARVKGLDWRIAVINAMGPMGFGVPDGSLFVSDGLVQALDDTELAAVVAHLMGHELYQHARACASRHNVMVLATLVGSALQVAGGGVGLFLIPKGGYLALISDPVSGYTQEYEVEANYYAAVMLSDANLPPDSLFDAFIKLSGINQPYALAFDRLHHLPDATLEYGLMLDAGLSAEKP